ncbi:hypothetical protein HDU96_010690 [Phlyctochytrium bullatum]|nr:hypothetical protein HDU96_010690 [Phlyctochytrium bullatum]
MPRRFVDLSNMATPTISIIPSSNSPYLNGLPNITDLQVTGLVIIRNPTSTPLLLRSLAVRFHGELTISVTDERPKVAMDNRRVHKHLDFTIPVKLHESPDAVENQPPRIVPVQSRIEVPFKFFIPVSRKLYPAFDLSIVRDPDDEDDQIIMNSCIASVAGPQIAFVADKVGRLLASNRYHLSATAVVVGPFLRTLSSSPIRVLNGMYPIEPEIVQPLLDPIQHRNIPLRPRIANTPQMTESPTIRLPTTFRTGRGFTMHITLPDSLLASTHVPERIPVHIVMHQHLRFALAAVHGTVDSCVFSHTAYIKPITGPQEVPIPVPTLPPTTFASSYVNFEYDIQVRVRLDGDSAGASAWASRLARTLKRCCSSLSIASLKQNKIDRAELSLLVFQSDRVPIVVAPFSRTTAARALTVAPWLLLPHKRAIDRESFPRRGSGSISLDGMSTSSDEATWCDEDMSSALGSGDEEEDVEGTVVRIPTGCYRRPLDFEEESLPVYEPASPGLGTVA